MRASLERTLEVAYCRLLVAIIISPGLYPCSKLSMYLPNKVDEERGKAKWDSKQRILSVNLPRVDNEFP